MEQQELKLDRKSQENGFERDQQYEGINVTIDENFDPTKHITTTYLWTNRSGKLSEPKVTTTDASWFPEGNFQISTKGETTGYLLDGTTNKSEDTCGLRSNQANFEYQVLQQDKVLTSISKIQDKSKENQDSGWKSNYN